MLTHPGLEVLALGSDSLAGRGASALDPRLNGSLPSFVSNDEAAASGADVLFLCLDNEAAAAFGADGAYNPAATRAQLATVTAPVLLIAGEVDLNSIPSVVAELADLFPNAELVVQPGAGHFPWVDDAAQFVATTAAFLG